MKPSDLQQQQIQHTRSPGVSKMRLRAFTAGFAVLAAGVLANGCTNDKHAPSTQSALHATTNHSSSQTADSQAAEAFRIGTNLEIVGFYPKALESFSRAIELKPGYAEAYANRGGCYYAIGDYAQQTTTAHDAIGFYQLALKDFSTAISLKPGYAGAYRGRRDVYRALGMKNEADADNRKAESLQSQ